MIDPSKISEEELVLLEEVAKSKNITLEEVIAELGHVLPKTENEPDDVVELSGVTEEPAESTEVPVRTISFGANPEDAEMGIELPEAKSALELPPAEEEEPEIEPQEEQPASGSSTLQAVCSHCGWDQSRPVIEEPSSAEKVSFLQSVLGMKPFKKTMSLFGGNLSVTFRTLTIKEIDKLYASAYEVQQSGKISTASDYYEYLNRLRTYLQILTLKGSTVPLHHQLPDGLDVQSNDNASTHWEDFLKEKEVYVESKSLPLQVQDYVIDKVLKTEQMSRVITVECGKFNRLAAKLEARVDDPDFWKETEQLS